LLGRADDSWRASADRRGIPLVILDPTAHGFAAVAGGQLVLVRPDQHIAWMGTPDADPADVFELALRGFLSTDLDSSILN
jgi:hypothetical protein